MYIYNFLLPRENEETTTINQTAVEILENKQRHKDLTEETVAVGMMFASKAFVQLLANPVVGPLTHKYESLYLNFRN